LLRLVEPLFDEQLVGVFRQGTLKAAVFKKKLDDIALPRAGSPGEGLDVSLRKGRKPPPALSQRAAAASNDLLDGWIASKTRTWRAFSRGIDQASVTTAECSNESHFA
jgi:hypothetical protein